MSGYEVARRNNERVREIELTTVADSDGHAPKEFQRAFRALVKRIRRKFGSFEYCGKRELTPEANLLHIHITYRGAYIPQVWLANTWRELHDSPIVWIRELFSWSYMRHMAAYSVKEGVGRFLCSHKWVFRGFVGYWKRLLRESAPNYGRAVAIWKNKLRYGELDEYVQAKIAVSGPPKEGINTLT
jgi:hypothetical protein